MSMPSVKQTHVPKKVVSTPAPLGKAYIPWVWTVAIALVLAFVGYGISVLGYPSPPFGLARLCFLLSGVVLASAIVFTALNLAAAPLLIRLTISALGVAASMFMAIAGVVWIAWRQSEFDSQRSDGLVARQVVSTNTAAETTASTTHPSSTVTASTLSTPSDGPAETVTIERDPDEPGSRQHPFTTADVRKMIEPYATRTSIEADALTRRYVGRWLRVNASVFNVSPADYDPHKFHVLAYLDDKLAKTSDDVFIFGSFNDTRTPAVKVLHRGERIVTLGKIAEIHMRDVTLEDCELVLP